LNTIIRTAYAGETAGVVFENERRFDLVVRMNDEKVSNLNLNKLYIRTNEGYQIPVSEVADVEFVNGPLQINRDETKRRIVIGVNVREGDIQQVVSQIQEVLEENIQLQPGYYFEYGGQFENLQNAIDTLTIVIPVALALILLLLFFAFKSVTYTLVVFSTVPLSLIGGIVALWLRGLPFSISAGVGFIALFGVAVLNGILMINHFNALRHKNKYTMCTNRIITTGCPHLLRPVFLTGLVASLGFVPMAIATSAGAEVQRPLATVVIGGLILSTFLTLLIIPVFYKMVNSTIAWKKNSMYRKWFLLATMVLTFFSVSAQQPVSLEEAIEIANQHHPRIRSAISSVEKSRTSRGEVWDIPATSVSYAWGQLNSDIRSDKELEVSQSVGSLLTPFYKNTLVSREIRTGEYYTRMVRKEITAEVKRAWAYYVYALHTLQLYKEQSEWADRLQKAGNLRYEQGDITLLEKNMATSVAADIRTRRMQAEEEIRLAIRRFTWACYSEVTILPNDTSLKVWLTPSSTFLSEAHEGYFQSHAEEKETNIKIERSRFFPELSVGYNRQTITPYKGLDAWMVGISFPLWFVPGKSRIKQAKIDYSIARMEADYQRQTLNNRIMELQSQLLQQGENIRYYTTAALPEADALLKSALVQFYESDTDIHQFIQSLNTVRDIRQGYIETVYNYNVSVLELELYTD